MADGVIQEIKDRLNIVEVIGSYIQLKQAGVNWKANCPFHNEKTASFNVNPSRQIWHCFGCNEGGDVFTFVQKHEHLDFVETLKLLADRAGVTLPDRRQEDAVFKDQKDRLFRVNNFAAKFYHSMLLGPAGAAAREYLQRRGVEENTITSWQIGYAPEGYQVLEKPLLAKGARREDLVAAGVSVQGERGTYDRFRGRITFPIFNPQAQVVGFSARILVDDGKSAKYINSPESPIYHKGATIFGLNFARNAIIQSGEVVVVEGQMDCIKPQQAGFLNTVATSGTAFTEEHLRILKRYASTIFFAFDQDEAGQKALYKSGQMALRLGFAVRVIRYTGAKDPDELISKNPALWEEAVKKAVWFVDFFLQRAEAEFPARSLEQRKFISTTVVPLIGLLTDSLERDYFIKKLEEEFGMEGKTVRAAIQSATTGAPLQSASPVESYVEAEELVSAVEKNILGALAYKQFRELFAKEGTLADFTHPDARELAGYLLRGEQVPDRLQSLAQEAEFMVESQSQNDGEMVNSFTDLQKTFYTFRLLSLRTALQNITPLMRQAERSGNTDALRELQQQFAHASATRLELERKIQDL